MGLWKSLAGTVRIEITGAEPSKSLMQLSDSGITLFHVTYSGELCVLADISRQNYRKAIKILTQRGDTVKRVKKSGLYWSAFSLGKRPVLLVGLLFYIFAFLFLPTRVFFVQVKGNHQIPTNYILEQSQKCGITFGASRRQVRSEKIKNALLEKVPQLQWVGVNTSGCVAVIQVEEKAVVKEPPLLPHTVSHIAAKKDAVILECTVKQGNLLCSLGQAVTEGQILVSGYTDCGLSIQATRAQAEIFGQTLQNINSVILAEGYRRNEVIKHSTEYTLIIGKQRYPLTIFGEQEKPGVASTKTVTERKLTLPGGFTLPVSILEETYTYYETSKDWIDTQSVLAEYTSAYTMRQMIAGEIQNKQETYTEGEHTLHLQAQYLCREMIGQEVEGKMMDQNSSIPNLEQ